MVLTVRMGQQVPLAQEGSAAQQDLRDRQGHKARLGPLEVGAVQGRVVQQDLRGQMDLRTFSYQR